MTTTTTARSAIKLLNASAARFGHRGTVTHKRSESRFSLMPTKGKPLIPVFVQAIKPMLDVVSEAGQVGVRVTGVRKSECAEIINAATSTKWKWYLFEDASILFLPRSNNETIAEAHMEDLINVLSTRKGVQIGIGAVARV